MPKMKTKSGAAKRFKVAAQRPHQARQAFMRHILTKKTTKRKRHLRGTTRVHDSDHALRARDASLRLRRPTMPRVKRGVTARARHKKVLAQAKGFRGRRSNVFRIAKEAVMNAGQYAYRDRRNKKREFRACGSRASTPRCASSA